MNIEDFEEDINSVCYKCVMYDDETLCMNYAVELENDYNYLSQLENDDINFIKKLKL